MTVKIIAVYILAYSLMVAAGVWLNTQFDVHNAYTNNIAFVFFAAMLAIRVTKVRKGLSVSKYWLSIFAGINYALASHLIFILAGKPTLDAFDLFTTFLVAAVVIILMAKYKVI